jgi:hypothetical protein
MIRAMRRDRLLSIALPSLSLVGLMLVAGACGEPEASPSSAPNGVASSSSAPKATATANTPPAQFLVSPGRVGRLRAGMPIRAAVSAGLARRERHDEEGCDPYWELTDPDLAGYFEWTDFDHIFRIEIEGERYRTAAGIGTGSSVADLRRAYGSRLSRLAIDEDFMVPSFLLTTKAGSMIFALALRDGQPVTDRSEVAYMSVIPPATGQVLVELAVFQDSDPC